MRKNCIYLVFAFFPIIILCQQMPKYVDQNDKDKGDWIMEKRRAMVEEQIIARGIKDSLVLNAMMKVERHLFVPENLKSVAYNDEPLPIGRGQTISQPYIVAYMTEALNLKGGEKVLEIGTGSGYQAAVLAEIVDEVYTIEIVESLSKQAEKLLKLLGYHGVNCRAGDGYKGWEEEAPFDAIIVTAAPPRIPAPLLDQLKEGGRMILPVGTWFQELIRVVKTNNKIKKERLIPVRFVPMTGKIQEK